MKKFFSFFFLLCCLSVTSPALAGNDGFTITYNPTTQVAVVGYESSLGFLSWGPAQEGIDHTPYRSNPLVVQYDQIQRAEFCVLDGGGCFPAPFGTTIGGTFIIVGQIQIPLHRDFQIKVTTWSGETYWAAIDAPGKPVSMFWHLTGCYIAQRGDGTWGVRMDP